MMTTAAATKPTTMSAKFPGSCRCGCGAHIERGQRIEWSRDQGARLIGHTSPATSPVTEVALGVVRVARPSSPVRTTGRRGGCRGCGGPIVSAAHHRAMGGYCGSCAFDEYDC